MLKTEFGQHRQEQDGVHDQIDSAVFSDGKDAREYRKGNESQEHDGHTPTQVVGRVPIECFECAHGSCSHEFSLPCESNRFFAPYTCRIYFYLRGSAYSIECSFRNNPASRAQPIRETTTAITTKRMELR